MTHSQKLKRWQAFSCVVSMLLPILVGCGFVQDEAIIGPYRWIAVDDPNDMTVCYTVGQEDCVGRIPGTVFSVGWDDRYIVAKQHALNDPSTTHYFILEMARDSLYAEPSASVTGPLTEQAFTEKAKALHLPNFKKTKSTSP